MGLFFGNKNKDNKLDNQYGDDDLDMDFGDLDDIFVDTKSRTPIERVSMGVKEGIHNAIRSPSLYKGLVLNALPSEYKTVETEVSKNITKLSNAYDSAAQQLKPQLSTIAKKVDGLIPENQKIARKLYESTLGKFKQEADVRITDNIDANQAQITAALEGIFNKQRDADINVEARRRAEESVKSELEHKKTVDTFSILGNIDANTAALRGYQDNITQAHQKKTLELQYRSYFVQADLLKNFLEYRNKTEADSAAIVKNTALPDFVKISKHEKLKDVFATRFGDKLYSGLFQSNFAENLTNTIASKMKEVVAGVQSAVFGLDMASSIVEDPVHDLATEGGSMLAKGVANYTGGHIKGLIDKNPKLANKVLAGGKRARNILLDNTDAHIEDFLQKQSGSGSLDDGFVKGTLKNALFDVLRSSINRTTDTKVESTKTTDEINAPSIYNYKAHTSITNVIPGYLSKILREVTAIRTKDSNSPGIVFDYTTNKFTSTSALASTYRDNFLKQSSSSDSEAKRVAGTLVKDTGSVNVDELSKFISDISKVKSTYSPEAIRNLDAYKTLTDSAKQELDTYLDSIQDDSVAKADLEHKISFLRKIHRDPRGVLEKGINLGHGELLESAGYLKKDKNNLYNADLEAIFRQGTKVSDPASTTELTKGKRRLRSTGRSTERSLSLDPSNIRSGIVSLAGSSVEGIQKPIVSAIDRLADLYKHAIPGVEDTKQEGVYSLVKTGFDSVVERLTALVEKPIVNNYTVGGMGFSGIPDLFSLFSSYEIPPDIKQKYADALQSGKLSMNDIREDVGKTYAKAKKAFGESTVDDILSGGKTKVREAGSSLKGIVLSAAKVMSETVIPNVLSAVGKGGRFLVDTGSAAIGKTAELARSAKDPVFNAMSKIFSTMLDFSKKSLELGKDLIFNKLPAGVKSGYTAIKKLSELVSRQYLSTDVYVKGDTEPRLHARLLRNGYYLLRDTGIAIYTFKDIKGTIVDPEGNIVLSTEDISKGLVDVEGNPISTPLEKLITGASNILYSGARRVKDFLVNGINFDNFSFGINVLNSKIVDILTEIRDVLYVRFGMSKPSSTDTSVPPMPQDGIPDASTTSTNSGTSTLDKLSTLKDKLFSKVSEVKDSFGSSDLKETTSSKLNTLKSAIADKLSSAKDKIVEKSVSAKTSFTERLARIEEEKKNKHQFKEATVTARYKDGDGVIGTVGKMFNFVKDMFSVGGLSTLLGGVLTKIPLVGGLLAKLGSFFGLGKAVGSTVAGVAGIVGRGILGAGKIVRSIATGTLGLGAKIAAPILSTAGGALFSGAAAAGSTIAGAVGTVGSTLLGAAAAVITSPVSLAVLGTTAVAYGGYKLYKHFTKNDLSVYDRIRYLQYGLDLDNETHIAKIDLIKRLEEFLAEEAIVVTKDSVTLSSKIDAKKLLESVDVDINNKDAVETFTSWFINRFKPVFLKHNLGILKANPKYRLSSLKSLTDTERLTYLSFIADDVLDIYSYNTPPFTGMANLVSRRVLVKAELLKQIASIDTKAINDTSKKRIETLKNDIVTNKIKQERMTALSTARDRKEEIGLQGITKHRNVTPRDSFSSGSSFSNKGSDYPTASNANTAIPQGDGATHESTVKLGGSSIPFSRELRVAGGSLRDGSGANEYITLAKASVNIDSLDPSVKAKLLGMIEEYGDLTGKKVVITDGYRSYQEQARLRALYPNKAAPPGKSLHEFGLAVDVDRRNLNEMDSLGLMRKYGFTRPVGGEPWHMEPAGIQGDIARARQDMMFRKQAIETGVGKGGGGYGSSTSSTLGRRNDQVAKAAMFGSAKVIDPNNLLGTSSSTGGSSYSAAPATTSTSEPVLGGDLSKVKADPSIVAAIDNASKKVGVDTSKMLTLAAVESDFKPKAKAGTSSASGLFQFTEGTYKEVAPKVGLSPSSDPTDINNSSLAGAAYTKTNENILRKTGVNPGLFESYTAHFLGPGGANKLLNADTDIAASSILPSAAQSNKNIFFDNGQARSVEGVKDVIRDKLATKAKHYNIPVDSSVTPHTATTPVNYTPPIAQERPKPTLSVSNPLSVPARTSIDTTIDNYRTVVSETLNTVAQYQKGMLDKLTSIDSNLLRALSAVIDTVKPKSTTEVGTGLNRQNTESLNTPIDLTRPKRA